MPLESGPGLRSLSPASSGRASPNLRAGRKVEEASLKNDKSLRRYAAGIDKALSSFDPNQQEWADYIAFLGRLLKAIQAVKQTDVVPHASHVSLRLAQCLNPSLPSGVHQKAIEVYSSVFGILGSANLGRDLQTYLPGLLPVLSFASLTVRPLFYSLCEDQILKLDSSSLRPALKSIILSLLPGIEDETSEDFDRGISILNKLRSLARDGSEHGIVNGALRSDGYFWQCFFLAVITSPTKRQGALAFLSRQLPHFGPSKGDANGTNGDTQSNAASRGALSVEAEAIIRPDPGLLLRSFAAGLKDQNILVQRGFLDLLVTHLPLQSLLFQELASPADLDLLVMASVGVVLRRDMSLNRRLWSWYLGPEPVAGDANGDDGLKTPASDAGDSQAGRQATYFQSYGAQSLQRCILSMFKNDTLDHAEHAKPFRICSALMDRWEIGGYLVPMVFTPALFAAFDLSQSSSQEVSNEVIKSASLFFDGIESSLIWSQIINELSSASDVAKNNPKKAFVSFRFLRFVMAKFNVREEDMLVNHIPRTALVAIHGFTQTLDDGESMSEDLQDLILEFILSLVTAIPEHAFRLSASQRAMVDSSERLSREQCSTAVESIKKSSQDFDQILATPLSAKLAPDTGALLQSAASDLFQTCLKRPESQPQAGKCAEILTIIMNRVKHAEGLDVEALHRSMEVAMIRLIEKWSGDSCSFIVAASTLMVWTDVTDSGIFDTSFSKTMQLEELAIEYLWNCLSLSSPKHHVESVRLMWRWHRMSAGTENAIDIDVFVSERLLSSGEQVDQVGRFMTLWEHTVQQPPSRSERKGSTLIRRTSSFTSAIDISVVQAEKILFKPLTILLDGLSFTDDGAGAMIAAWLRNLPSLDRVFSVLLMQLEIRQDSFEQQSKWHNKEARSARAVQQDIDGLQVTFSHIMDLLRHGSQYTWKVLTDLRSHDDDPEKQSLSGIQFLAEFSTHLLATVDVKAHSDLHRKILGLLDLLLISDAGVTLQDIHVEEVLIARLMDILKRDITSLQTDYLAVLSNAIKVREMPPVAVQRASLQSNNAPAKPYELASKLSVEAAHHPPTQLFQCIKEAVASPSAQIVLEHWIDFLTGVLPIYSQAMFSAMIPLVEVFCRQINHAFSNLRAMSTRSLAPDKQVPISSLTWLLHGLELVLASAHSGLEPSEQQSAKPMPSPQGLFGSSTASIMSPPSNLGKSTRSNSRLTVILCLHDAVQICFNMWSWASYGSDAETADPVSSATTTFNALKLRNRTKKILEHLFSAEGLECLETLAVVWVKAKTTNKSEVSPDSVFSVLNVLGATRPRNAMPLILNALYSRTNVEALDANRRSSLTSDLSALDVIGFLLQYLSTIEDDALDEIWSDSLVFLKDVLSNPMPHRQVLPALLEMIALLAEKIDNTNFGELQRMHRDLADIFSRLLTATFTVRPAAGNFEGAASKSRNTVHNGDLFTSLTKVTPKLQSVLESKDRVLSVVNNITTYAVSPTFHAKMFPENIRPEFLELILLMSAQSPDAKLWKREVSDAFSDARIFSTSQDMMATSWFPVLRKWSLTEKDVISDILARIVAPSTAALMFGVGANSARLSADRIAQHNLRRTSLLLLANDQDALASSIKPVDVKLAELCTANASSSPSCATRAEVFMLWRALFLTTSEVHLAGLWPNINATLQAALLSALPDGPEQDTYNNLSLLQACKLLDLLSVLQPDDFQLQEWVFLTNTIDAVYAGTSQSSAIVDEVAEALTAATADDPGRTPTDQSVFSQEPVRPGTKKPMLALMRLDAADAKAMARDDFVKQILMPFFSGLSIAAYEGTYGMGIVDMEVCRQDLVRDLMDEGTVV